MIEVCRDSKIMVPVGRATEGLKYEMLGDNGSGHQQILRRPNFVLQKSRPSILFGYSVEGGSCAKGPIHNF